VVTLVLFNVLFLAHFGLFYPILLVSAATADFLIGIGLGKFAYDRKLARKLLIASSFLVNVGLLVASKSVPHFLSPHYSWVFPLSLSFYCFQSLTYTIDCYRGTCEVNRNYLSHLAAATLFITVVSGPINRIGDLLKKIASPFSLSRAQGGAAILLIGMGLVKKLLIADFLADNLVNRVFDTPKLYSGAEVLLGVYGYALQLYFDFSGYTDIIIGVGQLFGLELPQNFDRPYLSTSIVDFWRRWHITFSFWLRDYLYIFLLGGNRRGRIRKYINLVATMILGGLWHGFTLPFAIWGLLHGIGLSTVHAFRALRGKAVAPQKWVQILSAILTFNFVTFTWIFFRAANVGDAFAILQRIRSGTLETSNITPAILLVLLLSASLLFVPRGWLELAFQYFGKAPFFVQGAALALVVITIQLLVGRGSAGFVYQNF
jgi:D-alanyl-lipoteichoic acid acyltransferase DltB (MBOAT superfamily)